MRICPACLFDRCDDHATRCRQCGAELTPIGEEVSTSAISSAWFHYLKIPKIGTLELVPGQAFTFGRGKRNDLVMPNAKGENVATIFWTDSYDEATIKELGAPEAVKVESVRLKGTRTLKGGEELEVGRLVMSYLKRATPVEDARKPGKKGRSSGPRGKAQVRESRPRKVGGRAAAYFEPQAQRKPAKTKALKARTVIAPPAKVALAMEKRKATGTLRVTSRQGRGWVTLMSGKPQFAAFGDLNGAPALGALLRVDKARCEIVEGLPRRGRGKQIEHTFTQIMASMKPMRPPAKRPPPKGRPGARRPPKGRPPRRGR